MAVLFPINAMRNAGLLLAATPLVMMMDTDMLISPELSALTKHTRRHVKNIPLAVAVLYKSSTCRSP